MVHRIVAGSAAAVLLTTALIIPPPASDCLEWCDIEMVLLTVFGVLVGWPAVVPDRWLRAALPVSIVVAVLAWGLGTTATTAGMRVIQLTAAGAMFFHWLLWRMARRRQGTSATRPGS